MPGKTKLFRVRMPDGLVYPVRAPANSTPAQRERAILKLHPKAAGTGRVPKEGALGKVETAGMGLTRGIDEALFGTARLFGQGLRYAGATDTGRAVQDWSERELRQSRANYEPFLRANPATAETGRIGGNLIGMAVPGGAAARVAKVGAKIVPAVAPVVNAMTTGGFSTGLLPAKTAVIEGSAAAATTLTKAVDAVLRIAGGGVGGYASSAVLGQDTDEGAAVGAGLSLIPLVGKYGAGPVWDMLKGRVGVERASKIFADALAASAAGGADMMRTARDAFAKGGKGTASQVLARMGIDADTFFATGNLVKAHGAGTGLLDYIERTAAKARDTVMDFAAGGGTRTASRNAAAEQRAATSAQAAPLRNEALGTVNTNTQNAMAAAQEAGLARTAAGQESRTAKRFLSASDEQAMRLSQMDDLGDAFDPTAINRQRGVVGGLERQGAQAAERSLQAGAAARTAEQRLAELQAQGIQPLDAQALSGRFRQMASQEVNEARAGALNHFADRVEQLAAENRGLLDANDLYEIRKEAGGIVEGLLSRNTAPASIRKRTAEVVGAMRPVIDDAIEAAGGKGWRDYLNTFSTGMDEARRIELSDFARKLATDQPEQFQRLMGGDRPDIVERFFGKGNYDVNAVLGPKGVDLGGGISRVPAGPSRLPAMGGVAEELGLNTAIKNNLTPGAKARAQKLIEPPKNAMERVGRMIPFDMGAPLVQGSQAFGERVMEPRTVRALEKGFATPQGASALLNFEGAGQRGINLLEGLSPDVLRTLQQFGVQTTREEPSYMNQVRR